MFCFNVPLLSLQLKLISLSFLLWHVESLISRVIFSLQKYLKILFVIN